MSSISVHQTYQLYRYCPSLAAAAVFCVLFSLTAMIHLWQMIRKKAWFLNSFVIGGFFEIIGYACRIVSARSPPGEYYLVPYLLENSFILMAPACFAATIYMTLGRIIKLIDGDNHSIVSGDKVTRFFLWGDFAFFALQGAGGALVAMEMKKANSSKAQFGNKLILAGLAFQLLWFTFFIIVAALLHYRVRLSPTMIIQVRPDIKWQRYLGSLYFVSMVIVIRSAFRLAEYVDGRNGYLQSQEVFFYVFESALMLIVMVWTNWQHPGEISLLLREKEFEERSNDPTQIAQGKTHP